MSDGDGNSILAIFVLTIFIFLFLEGTIFYEPPSCVTSNADPVEFTLSLFVSAVVAVTIYLISIELLNMIKERIK